MSTEWGIVDIHGTPYHTVAKRVSDFRGSHLIQDGWSIKTKILDHVPDTYIVMRAKVLNPEGRVVGTGHAYEKADAMGYMGSSMLEVAETSAVGRALAMAGFAGTQSEIASADEVKRRSYTDYDCDWTPHKTTRVLNALIGAADKDDFAGCLEIWEELEQHEMLHVNRNMDKYSKKTVGNAIQQARQDRGDFDVKDTTPMREKDIHREQVRAAKNG